MTTQSSQLRRKSNAVDTVRGGPGIFYEDVAGINADTPYTILGKYHTGQSGDIGTWWQIERPDPDVASGWVRGDNVETEGDVSGVRTTWQPYTATLRTGSLALPFAPGEVFFRITSLFDDPRRGPMGWDPEQRNLPIHNGIDWAMAGSVYAMAAGRVTHIVTGQPENDPDAGYGNRVIVQSDGFRITYAHLATVAVAKGAEVIPFDSSLKKNTKPGQPMNTPLGTAGRTGFSTGVHLHAYLEPDYTEEIPDDHKQVGGAVNFQEYLPAGHYHWPDIAALQAEIAAASENGASKSDLDDLGRLIDHWMDNALQGEADPNKARLMVTPGRPVYMLPRVDEEFAYPCRLFPDGAIVGMNQVMWDLSFYSPMFVDATPIPEWWRIRINPSFPACWVRNKDAEEIGGWRKTRLAPPSLPTDLPRYLQKANDDTFSVRTEPHTQIEDTDGNLEWTDKNIITSSHMDDIVDKWVPIVDLACDATTGNYLWYQIPYRDPEEPFLAGQSNATGWVRGDVVDHLRGPDPAENTLAFPNDDRDVIKPKVPWPTDTAPRATIGPDQTVEARVFPDRGSPARGFAGTTRIRGIFKGITPSNPFTWYQLQLAQARRGWVRADQVTAHNTNGLSAVQPRLRRWSGPGHTGGVPVYGGPSPYETQLATLAADSTAWHSLLGRDAAHPGWWHIQYNDTVSGWVRADDAVETEGNLNSAPPPRVGLANPAQACTVRAEPSATGTELGTIAAGSTDLHPVLERDADPAAWYQIRFGDTVTGWVSTACVRLHGDGRNLPVSGPRPRASLKPGVTDGLKVRFGPGQAHAWIASIPGGSTVRYALLGKDADFPTWYQISFSDTVTGWVHGDYVQTHGSLGQPASKSSCPGSSFRVSSTTDGFNARMSWCQTRVFGWLT